MMGRRGAGKKPPGGGWERHPRHWSQWVLKKVKAEIGDLYPRIPDPAYTGKREDQQDIFGTTDEVPPGYLMPVAYLRTRTVICKNPSCKATVPLLRHTRRWKQQDHYLALT